jgi:hypothetical protein
MKLKNRDLASNTKENMSVFCEFKVVGSDKVRESITELCRWSS